MENNYEQNEAVGVTTDIINQEELSKIVYDKNHPENKLRFSSVHEGGVFKLFSRDGFFDYSDKSLLFSVVKVADKIVGIATLRKIPNKEGIYFITTVSVDPEFQGQGYASLMMEEIFKFAKDNSFALEATSYEEDGRLKLKPILHKLAKKYGVNFIDPDEKDNK